MLEWIHSLPYPWVFLFFWCLGMMRSHTMYWIGRGVTAGTARTRWSSLLESPMYARAQSWSARWGVLAVPMSFLTVGLHTPTGRPRLSAGVHGGLDQRDPPGAGGARGDASTDPVHGVRAHHGQAPEEQEDPGIGQAVDPFQHARKASLS